MVGLVRSTDHVYGAGRQMMWIGRGQIILKRFVVRQVICRGEPPDACVLRATNRRSISISTRRVETTLEPTPGYSPAVQQVADVTASQFHQILPSSQTILESRPWIANHGSLDDLRVQRTNVSNDPEPVSLSRNEVDCTWSGGPKRCLVGVVAHRKVLCVVPECCDCVAIVVAHDNGFAQTKLARRSRDPGAAGELSDPVGRPGRRDAEGHGAASVAAGAHPFRRVG